MNVNRIARRRIVIVAVAALLTAAAAAAGEPGGTPDALYFGEAAAGAAAGMAMGVGAYIVGGNPHENDGTAREKASFAAYALMPAASALGVYVVGERAGMPARNRGECLLWTAAASFGGTGAAAALGYVLTKEDKTNGALTAAFYTVVPVAFLNALVYNRVKEPRFAEIPGFSLRVAPTLGVCRSPSGAAVAVYGVGVAF